MPWVVFTANFNWTPANNRRRTTGYKDGHMALITRACAVAAAGRFDPAKAPSRSEAADINIPIAVTARISARKVCVDG